MSPDLEIAQLNNLFQDNQGAYQICQYLHEDQTQGKEWIIFVYYNKKMICYFTIFSQRKRLADLMHHSFIWIIGSLL